MKNNFVASFCDCGSKCKMLATVREGCLLSIEPDTDGTPLRFSGCPRGRAYGHTYLTSKRLRFPMERIAARGEGKFRRISWEEAVSKIAEATRLTKKEYGPGSRFVINAAGVSAAIRGDRFMKNLLSLDGGYLDYYNYYSAACAAYIAPYIYGKVRAGNHESTYVDSKLIIMWGFNPATCHYGLGTKDYFMKAKEKGAKIIVIDPRMSDTVMTMADTWIPIRPSSDTALIDAMAHTIWQEGLQDQQFMDKFCIGFDEDHMPDSVPTGESYHSHVFGLRDGIEKTPQWAEKITGIPASVIRELAIEYACTKPAALLPGFAPQRTLVGEQVCRGFVALACMTGNVGLSGGSTGIPYLKEGHDAPGMSLLDNPYPGKIPVFQWTRAIDRPDTVNPEYTGLKGVSKLDSGIKIIYSLASGIVMNQHSNSNDTKRILQTEGKLSYLILSDLFMTPSAKFADILLPGVSFFEIDNIPSPWADDDYLLYNHHITEPLFKGRFEYEWIREVARLLGLKREFDCGLSGADQWLRYVYDQCRRSETELPEFDEFKEKSFYVYKSHKPLVNFSENINEGVPFNTPSGKIEIFSKTLYDMNRPEDIPGSPGHIYCVEGPEDPLKEKYPLQLIAYHTKRRCHSQNEENSLLKELDPTALWINPADASARGISDGDMAEVFNDRGIIRIPAKVTRRIAAGTVAVSEGGWYRLAGDGADVGGCINTLTMTDKATPIANGNPQHTNLTDVRKA
ncbi:MAG: molybdopterin-dependent oxidoreductase [Firmicutes bacterium]|nr:molybdopterin-dependent oxidoreductase [Bacillota bacterium]